MQNGDYEGMTREQLYLLYRKAGVLEFEGKMAKREIAAVLKRKFPPKPKAKGAEVKTGKKAFPA